MNEMTYAVAVLAALGGSYIAFVRKEASVYSSLWVVGWSGVLAFGSLDLVRLSNGTAFTYTSETTAILWGMNTLVGIIVFAASVTGQYSSDSGDDSLASPEYEDLTGGKP